MPNFCGNSVFKKELEDKSASILPRELTSLVAFFEATKRIYSGNCRIASAAGRA
jgi:hypothetical protein